MTETTTEQDRIERSIDIEAPAERVWALLQRPGWWINEHDVDPDPQIRQEGEDHVVVHETWGEFRLRTVRSEEPRHIAYRWLEQGQDAGTLVEFWVEDRPQGGGVTLRVVESGFGDLGKSPEDVARHVRENTQGWEAELAAARRFVVGAAA